jgi:hypothetical protein
LYEHLHHEYVDGDRLFYVVDAATAQARWQAAASTAQQRYVDGVQATTKDPMALAAAAAQKMLQGVTQAITSGYWQRRLSDVGQVGWKAAVAAKASNYGTGIQASGTKYQTGYQSFWNYMQPFYNQLLSMPSATLQDSIARATFWITNAAAYQKP